MSETLDIEPVSVGLLLSALNRGGAQRQVVALATGLAERGWSVSVVVLRSGGQLASDLRSVGVPVIELGGRDRLTNVLARLRLMRQPELLNADVVYSFLPAANVTASVAYGWRRRPRVVWGIRDSGLLMSHYDRPTQALGWLASRLRRSPRLIICNSAAARCHYGMEGYPLDRMVVIPNGIDVSRFSIDREAGQSERDTRGWSINQRIVLLLGRADPMKGHWDAIDAFEIVAQTEPEALLWIVGDHSSEFADELAARTEQLGIADRVVLEVATSSPERFLNAADLLLSASRFGEGFSNVLAEALACGVPVVATDVGDARLVVADDGAVVPPGKPVMLAAAIVAKLAATDSEPSARRRAERIAAEFSIDRLVERTADALRPVIDR